jgi:hypothetical protein
MLVTPGVRFRFHHFGAGYFYDATLDIQTSAGASFCIPIPQRMPMQQDELLPGVRGNTCQGLPGTWPSGRSMASLSSFKTINNNYCLPHSSRSQQERNCRRHDVAMTTIKHATCDNMPIARNEAVIPWHQLNIIQ